MNADAIRVAGLVPLSTVDWPGHLAAVTFLQGCPWRCVFCHNEGILDPRAPGQVSWSSVIGLLERRVGLLDGLVFSGGEPTMQPALVPASREVKNLGLKVGLHTGGAYPSRLRELVGEHEGANGEIRCLLDWVGLDLKAPPHLYTDVVQTPGPAWERFRESFAVLARARVPMEVRTTVTPGLCAHIEDLVHVYANLVEEHGATSCNTGDGDSSTTLVLQQARPDGAPASFAQCLPNKNEWKETFTDAAERARECGTARGIQIVTR